MAEYYRVYVSTADASYSPVSTTYALARSSTQATSTIATTAVVGQRFSTNYVCYQYFPIFDTSTIPSDKTSAQLSLRASSTPDANSSADQIEVRAVSSTANKIAGGSLNALTPYFGVGSHPTVSGQRADITLNIASMARTASCQMVVHSQNERLNVAPTGQEGTSFNTGDKAGTVDDPYLQTIPAAPWAFVGISNVVEVTAAAHALVTTGIAGTLQAGDLLVACISSRIASTTSVTLPTGGEWTLVSEQKNNNILATSSAASSGLMAYCVRGASNPNLTFTHPVAPSVAIGRIIAYRGVNQSSPKDTQSAATTATGTTAVSVAGLTTTQDDNLIVAMCAGGQEATWSAFNATDPATVSGFALQTGAPEPGIWLERADSATTTGVDTSLAIFDAIKITTGATGNLTATASLGAAHVVIAGAFKLAPAAGYTGTGTPAAQASDADGAGISSSSGTGAPASQSSTASGVGLSASGGTGALAAQDVTASGAGISASTGTGVLEATPAVCAGIGISVSAGSGSVVATSATVAGLGASASSGSGAANDNAAIVAGAGLSASIGTSALAADVAAVSGSGDVSSAAITGTGNAAADAVTVSGDGVSASVAIGVLAAQAATATGAGVSVSIGTGALVAGPATVDGQGVVVEEGVAIGNGALVAGAATIAGIGEVTGEAVRPPMGGVSRLPSLRPRPVEGYGYGILPELEGESHGVVLAVGLGVGTLPAPDAELVGAIGAAGRSLALLDVRGAASGDRGQAGVAAAVLKDLVVTGSGAAVVRGKGLGMIIKLEGAAKGQHDDDEAAAVAWLLAA